MFKITINTNVYCSRNINYTVSKNVPPMACYNFETHEQILIFFGTSVTDKVNNQKALYYATSNNLCFYTTWQNGETRKSHFSLKCCISRERCCSWSVLHAQCTSALSSWKKNCHLCCLIASIFVEINAKKTQKFNKQCKGSKVTEGKQQNHFGFESLWHLYRRPYRTSFGDHFKNMVFHIFC